MNIDDEKTSPNDVITSDVLVNEGIDGSFDIVHECTTDTTPFTTIVGSNEQVHDQNLNDNGTAAAPHSIVTAVPFSISVSNSSVPITCSTQTITNRSTTTASTRSINDIFINKMPYLKKTYRKTYERSNSAGKIYQTGRRVSFPENDSELVTGYLEPANPWATGKFLNLHSNNLELYNISFIISFIAIQRCLGRTRRFDAPIKKCLW